MRESSWTGRAWIAALAAAAAGAMLSAGCGAGPGGEQARWVAETDTVGDTIVVRTVSGGVWPDSVALVEEVLIGQFEGAEEYIFGQIGPLAVAPDGSIYLYDRQAKALRKYAPDGTYITTFGREGGGPGEYKNPDGGLAVLADGRVLLRDPGNARVNVYSPGGEPLESWRIGGGFSTSNPLVVDSAGRVYTPTLLDRTADVTEWRSGLARVGPEGTPADTLPVPELEYERKTIVARRVVGESRSTSVNTVPFTASAHWAFSPLGYFAVGISDRYGVTLLRTDGPILRIERAWEPVPVGADERAEQEKRATENMRGTDSDWRWNGPGIPESKPAFRGLSVAADGRIWVMRHVPSVKVEPDEPASPAGAVGRGSGPPRRRTPLTWIEPTVYDVFEPDGRYLGDVRLPDRSTLRFARGDHVWLVTRDELDVQYVARYRIVTGEPIRAASR